MRNASQDTLSASLTTLSRAERIGLAKIAYALALKDIAAGNAVEQSAWRITNDMRKQLERLDVDA
jgi:hypothetical protein